MKRKISFLVTYYNQEKYVSRSLDSILAIEKNFDWEILVGDDGSSDNTVEIVKKYQKKFPEKIKIFVQPRDINKKYLSVVRASQNRINLLFKAGGDYVCFLDGDDDYCNSDFVQTAIDELENKVKFEGIAFNHVVINPNGTKEYFHKTTDRQFITLKDYVRGLYIHVGAIVFRCPPKEALNKVLTLSAFDDNDITYFFLNRGNILYKDLDVYNYYSNDDGICSSIGEIEMKILNALDYETIKKIIDSSLIYLFLRYFDTIFFVYKKRKVFLEQRYQKWKEWPVKNSLVFKILDWNNQNLFLRIYITIAIYFKRTLFFLFKYGILLLRKFHTIFFKNRIKQ